MLQAQPSHAATTGTEHRRQSQFQVALILTGDRRGRVMRSIVVVLNRR